MAGFDIKLVCAVSIRSDVSVMFSFIVLLNFHAPHILLQCLSSEKGLRDQL